MEILKIKTMYLLEKDIDFTNEDLEKSVNGDFHLTQKFKENFMKKYGFTGTTQQFAMWEYQGKCYCQIEFEKNNE